MQKTWSVRSTLKWAHEHLRDAGVDEARLSAETLLAHALALDRFKLYLQPDLALTEAQLQSFHNLVEQRAKGIPTQHLIGCVSFMGCPLRLKRGVFIPRFETEELAEQALARLAESCGARFLDAGTGSGAIAIAIAKRCPAAQGVALDCSNEALELARKNALLNAVDQRLQFLQGDWLRAATGAFDVIVSNPPYIPTAQIAGLAPEVRDHDPRLALDGGPDGLRAIRELVEQAPPHLNKMGWLLLEMGQGQSGAVQSLLQARGYRQVRVYKDLAGIERIAEAQWEG